MKKVLILAVFVTCALFSFAQTESEHLTFKGVSIDGTLNEYVAKMKAAGFSYLGEEDGTAVLEGDFAGYKGCKIIVSTLKSKDLVSFIGVLFPENEKWWSAEKEYNELKSMLTEKYGKPSESVEKFHGYQPNTDSDKIRKLMTDEYTWFSTFSTPKGNIELFIRYQSDIHVVLRYSDKINSESIRAHAIEDL